MENQHFECKKVKYSSEKFALYDVERIKKKSDREKIPFRVYFCHCGSWHLTIKFDKRVAEINEHKIKKSELQKELNELKRNANKDDRILIKTDERIVELTKKNNTLTKQNKDLRSTNSDLVNKLIQLKKKYGEE
jgi:hypothetical protein